MNRVEFKYGNEEDFTSHKNAVKLSDEAVQKLIDEVVEGLTKTLKNNNYNNNYSFAATGDTIVIGFAMDEDEDGKLDSIYLYVCRDYEEAQGWVCKDGFFEKMNWERDYEREEFEKYSRDELIDMLLEAQYDPRREI